MYILVKHGQEDDTLVKRGAQLDDFEELITNYPNLARPSSRETLSDGYLTRASFAVS